MLATESERQNEMQNLLAKELEINGIRFDTHKWLSTPTVLNEISIAISSEVHEGLIPPMGILFVDQASELIGVSFVLVPLDHIDMARKFANGIDCFILYEKDNFFGLVYFRTPLDNELLFVRAFPPSGGLFVQRGPTGTVKFFQGNSIILQENRKWFTKPLIKEAAWKISRCVSQVNHMVLNRILEFSFHMLSPLLHGSTLVWWLGDIPSENLGLQSTGQDISEFDFSIMDEPHATTFCHFLSQIDGATFIDRNGKFLQTGIHLKNSNKSRTYIPELKGTRHTSAQRFSYDFSDTIVITVSSDGPVTIFSDGVNVASLAIHPAQKAAHDLRKKMSNKETEIKASSYQTVCQTCSKRLMVEEVWVEEWNKDVSIDCVVCGAPLLNINCFSLECRPYKYIVEN